MWNMQGYFQWFSRASWCRIVVGLWCQQNSGERLRTWWWCRDHKECHQHYHTRNHFPCHHWSEWRQTPGLYVSTEHKLDTVILKHISNFTIYPTFENSRLLLNQQFSLKHQIKSKILFKVGNVLLKKRKITKKLFTRLYSITTNNKLGVDVFITVIFINWFNNPTLL